MNLMNGNLFVKILPTIPFLSIRIFAVITHKLLVCYKTDNWRISLRIQSCGDGKD